MILLILLKGTVRIFVCYNIVIFKLQNHTELCDDTALLLPFFSGSSQLLRTAAQYTLSTDNSGM